MNRKRFLKTTILGALGLIIAPKIINPLEKKSHSFLISRDESGINTEYLDGKYNGFDFSNIECFYDFTNEEYSIKDEQGNIIGWKDISGHGHDGILTTANTYNPYKKFAISKNMNGYFTDDFAERMLNTCKD